MRSAFGKFAEVVTASGLWRQLCIQRIAVHGTDHLLAVHLKAARLAGAFSSASGRAGNKPDALRRWINGSSCRRLTGSVRASGRTSVPLIFLKAAPIGLLAKGN